MKAVIYSEPEDSEFSWGTNEACVLFCGVPSGAVSRLTWGPFAGILRSGYKSVRSDCEILLHWEFSQKAFRE